MRKNSIFSILILILFVTGVMIAAEGEVKVSATTIDCTNPDKETNSFSNAGQARIWLNVPGATSTVGLTYSITNEGNVIVSPTTFSVTGCGDGYFFGDFALPANTGTVTLSVSDSEGATIGSDTFKLE